MKTYKIFLIFASIFFLGHSCVMDDWDTAIASLEGNTTERIQTITSLDDIDDITGMEVISQYFRSTTGNVCGIAFTSKYDGKLTLSYEYNDVMLTVYINDNYTEYTSMSGSIVTSVKKDDIITLVADDGYTSLWGGQYLYLKNIKITETIE